MTKYIVSPLTSYDEDQQLYYTYVGLDNRFKSLLYSCWGMTEKESRERAEALVKLLTVTVHQVI